MCTHYIRQTVGVNVWTTCHCVRQTDRPTDRQTTQYIIKHKFIFFQIVLRVRYYQTDRQTDNCVYKKHQIYRCMCAHYTRQIVGVDVWTTCLCVRQINNCVYKTSNLRTSEDLFNDELGPQHRCQLVHISELRHTTFRVVEILTHSDSRILVLVVVVTANASCENHQHQSYISNFFQIVQTERQTDRRSIETYTKSAVRINLQQTDRQTVRQTDRQTDDGVY